MAMIPISKEDFDDIRFDENLIKTVKHSEDHDIINIYVFESLTSENELYSVVSIDSITFFKRTK
jgi:hypothetical protein